VLVPERFLDRVERTGRRQSFDRRDRAAVDLHSQAGARSHGDAVEQHGTGTALTGVAPDLGSGHTAEVAKEMDEELSRFHNALVSTAIDGDADGDGHDVTSRS
jgi:hypothetical protein